MCAAFSIWEGGVGQEVKFRKNMGIPGACTRKSPEFKKKSAAQFIIIIYYHSVWGYAYNNTSRLQPKYCKDCATTMFSSGMSLTPTQRILSQVFMTSYMYLQSATEVFVQCRATVFTGISVYTHLTLQYLNSCLFSNLGHLTMFQVDVT